MIWRALLAGMLGLLVFVAAPVSTASASPLLSIESPTSGTVTNHTRPVFSGATTDAEDVITVTVLSGGSFVESAEATPDSGGGWSVQLPTALADGQYSAVAEQTETLTGEAGSSPSVSFRVDTQPPSVTLDPVSSPTADSTPSFSGTASDTEEVTVYIFKGASAGGTLVAEAHASGTGGAWTSGDANHTLADGTYTAIAEQASSLGNEPGVSQERTFTVDTKPPSVSLDAIPTPSNDTTPSFTGFASDTTPVEVLIFKGSSAGGSPVAEALATGTGGAWSSGTVSSVLGEGSYTAIAVQKSSHGTGEGVSEAIHFAIVTASPKVTLNAVAASGQTQPSFSGTATDTTPVTILVYEGSKAAGAPVASAAATGTGGSWSSGHASPALAEGVHEYTAVAEQNSSLGNPTGVSTEVHFIVDTRSPAVTLNGVPTPSNNAKPAFSGSATDSTNVVVHIFDAAEREVASVSGSPSGGSWKAGPLSTSLSSGDYTAVAEQSSSLGNEPGRSEVIGFTVDTEPPVVTLSPPQARSNNTTPSFSGTATDTTPVTVSVYAGGSATGTPVAEVTASVTGGTWVSGTVSTPLVTGTYTARAVQKSSLGNADGVSQSRTFEVDTRSPTVTLEQPPERSSNQSPLFKGTATGPEKVTINVYKGSSASGTPVASTTAEGTPGAWTSAPVSKALEPGTYTARAVQKSSIGNPPGESEARTFAIDTSAPRVGLAALPELSSNASPVFEGTASEGGTVTVSIYREAVSEVNLVERVSGPASGGTFATVAAPRLATGRYVAVAGEPSAIGNAEGVSGTIRFAVNTEPPVVKLQPIAARTSDRSPSFKGTVINFEKEETKRVTVHVFDAEAHEVASVEATPNSSHEWSAELAANALLVGKHTYTAFATEPSGLPPNEAGKSATISFTVDTEPPALTLTPPAPSSNIRTPSFSGTSSEAGKVVVSVYPGGVTSGTPLRKVETEVAAGPLEAKPWSTAAISALPSSPGKYTVVARQTSALGNGEAKAVASFFVDPGLPTLTLNAPPAQLDTATPVFSGTSNQGQPVTVRISRRKPGPGACEIEGDVLATARAGRGGAWTTGAASPALAEGEYAAIAYQPGSSESGTEAATAPLCFGVDTQPPAVSLLAPAAGAVLSGGTVAAHGGAGSAPHDTGQVSVLLFAGTDTSAPPAQQVTVNRSGTAWGAAFSALAPGAYSIRAEQADEAGNVGLSAVVPFTIVAPSAPSGPSAAFTWYPAKPHPGEKVTLVSSSTDQASPITGYAWSLLSPAFVPGSQSISTSFGTVGAHTVRLRVTDAAGASSTATQTIPVTYASMRPFPIVRIATVRAGGRLRVRRLLVEAPSGASIEVRCIGRACPLHSQLRKLPAGRKAVPVSFTRFQRSFPPGVTLRIRVFAPGLVGKYTSFRIRRGKLPVRSDACVNATEPRPVGCPS